jgi:hypothetical protein
MSYDCFVFCVKGEHEFGSPPELLVVSDSFIGDFFRHNITA